MYSIRIVANAKIRFFLKKTISTCFCFDKNGCIARPAVFLVEVMGTLTRLPTFIPFSTTYFWMQWRALGTTSFRQLRQHETPIC